MHNKYIFHLIIASILWGFVPILVIDLFSEISILMIIFLRFFISGLIFLAFSLTYIILNNKTASNNKQKINIHDLFRFTQNKNKNFYNIKNIYYYSLIGFFGIILQIIGFFLALKTTSIAFTMIGFQLSIIILAFYEHGVDSEKLDLFKSLYLLILIFSIGIIIFVKIQEPNGNNSEIISYGFFYVLLFTACLSFLQIGMAKDYYSKKEIQIINFNNNYRMARMTLRISLIFLTGIAIMFPFLLILNLLPMEGDLSIEINQFFNEFPFIFQILLRWEVIFLIIFSTIIPYLLYFVAEANWSPYELTYNQWISILAIIEPITAIFFGVVLANEYFPHEFLIIIIFLLIISILFRYAHETKNKVNALLLISQKHGSLNKNSINLLKFNGVYSISLLIGVHDLLLNVKTNSIKDLYFLIDTQIRNLEGIKNITILFIKKINKLNIN